MISKGTTLKTPHLSKMFEEDYIQELIKQGEKQVSENWMNHYSEPCQKCHGTGKSSDPKDPFCYGCEGTGVWYYLYYGVEDKKPFAYTLEYGVDFVKEAAKDYREAWAEMQLAGKTPDNMRPFLMPKTLEMELEARGYTVRENIADPIASDQNKREIFNIVAREYPEFMCVPYFNF